LSFLENDGQAAFQEALALKFAMKNLALLRPAHSAR
jgi:hypothetical protein